MSQSATWDTMQIARDARLCGRLDVAAALQDEIDENLPAYSRASHRSIPVASNEAYCAFGARQRRGTDTDAYEMRVRSYANIIVPAWYVVFKDPKEGL